MDIKINDEGIKKINTMKLIKKTHTILNKYN